LLALTHSNDDHHSISLHQTAAGNGYCVVDIWQGILVIPRALCLGCVPPVDISVVSRAAKMRKRATDTATPVVECMRMPTVAFVSAS
jgi:hypothetical protein